EGDMRVRCVVACHNAAGEPDLFGVEVSCSAREYERGEHYEKARGRGTRGRSWSSTRTTGPRSCSARSTGRRRTRGVKRSQGRRTMIRAEVHSDDHKVKASFDATAFFERATLEEVLGLAEIGWGGNYEADGVAQFLEG